MTLKMKLQKLHIKNYKSLVDLEIIEPNPFTVFAGPNGAGKSNIFEALEFANFAYEWNGESAVRLFGGTESVYPRSIVPQLDKELIPELTYDFGKFRLATDNKIKFKVQSEFYHPVDLRLEEFPVLLDDLDRSNIDTDREVYRNSVKQFLKFYNRVFVGNIELVRIKEISNVRLSIDCSNLEKVLKRLLEDETKHEDITEYLELFIPGFEKIEINSDNLSGTDTLLIYEKGINKPFTKDLISDGTYHIICLLTAVFQSDEPQFLCIEEPENGLNPYVVQGLVDLFRLMCEDYGHYIWLNTHSQTLVRALKEEEIILVDKENGATQIKQFKQGDFYGLKADEAWLTNSLGAGIPW